MHSNFVIDPNKYSLFILQAVRDHPLDVIVWLYEVGWLSETDLVTNAAEHGRLDVMRWATLKGLKVT